MLKVGPCDVTVGPHLFDAMIYIVKDPSAPPPIQYASPQRPMVHYGPPNNFQQYQPYPTSPHPSQSYQQKRPSQYSPAPGRPPQSYTGNQSTLPQQAQHAPTPQRPPQTPKGQPSQPGQPAKPSPDPVIQMLATRAAADPELKALMRVVASRQASQEQLRAFQAHIDELNAIIKTREQQEQRQTASGTPNEPQQQATADSQSQPPPPSKDEAEAETSPQEEKSQQSPEAQTETPSKAPEPQAPEAKAPRCQSQGTPQHQSQSQTPSETQASERPNSQNSTEPFEIKQEPVNTSANNAQAGPAVPPSSFQQPAPRPGPPYPPNQQQPYTVPPTIQSRPPQYGSSAPYYRPAVPPPPARVNYKSVVFEFTSPLTPYGSSTSGHAGSGDRYLFPEYSILEWLPNENTVLASFLIVRKVDPNTPFPIEPASDAPNSRKGKPASKSKKGDKKGNAENGKHSNTPVPNQATFFTNTPQKPANNEIDKPDTATPDRAFDTNLKEYWQPVTFRIHAANPKVLEPLARVVKPADEVRKYMNEIMDRAERAPDGFLALRLPRERLPRENADAADLEEGRGTPVSVAQNSAAGRSRHSLRGKVVQEESEAESHVNEMDDEEELRDFYDAPDGLAPLWT